MKLPARLLSGLSCGQSSSPARTVFIRDVVSNTNTPVKNKLLLIITLLIFSCSTTEYKTIDFDQFQIAVPGDWNKYELKGIDSYVGGIITDTNDTLTFDLGRYSGDISEDLPMVYESESLTDLTKKERELLPDTKHLIIEDWSEATDVNLREYLKYKWDHDTVGGFPAKIITPTNKGFGASGIYIDSLRGYNQSKVKFNFYGFYLPEKTQAEFLQALKTIKFE